MQAPPTAPATQLAIAWIEDGAVDRDLDLYGLALVSALLEIEAYGPGYLFGLGELDALIAWHAGNIQRESGKES